MVGEMKGRASRIAMIVIALIGLGVASYLTYIHFSGNFGALICEKGASGISPCEAVQTSAYSKLGGVPVALLGLIGYAGILATLSIPERESTRLATLALTAIGFGFSVYLTSREVFSLNKICEWCVSSAVMMTILFALATFRFLTGDSTPASAGGAAPTPGAGTDSGDALGVEA